MSKKLWFIHIPKTAGTSIKLQLEPYLKNQEKLLNSKLMIKHLKKEYKNIKISTHHIPLFYFNEKFYKDYIQSKFIIFCIIRNPIERLISDLNNWFFVATYSNFWKEKLITFIKPKNNKLTPNKENLNKFINNLPNLLKNKPYLLDGHYIPQSDYIKYKPNIIIKFDNINEDFEKYFKIKLQKSENVSPKYFNSNDLNKESLTIIKKIYKNDFFIYEKLK
jgi:hypothetical protein